MYEWVDEKQNCRAHFMLSKSSPHTSDCLHSPCLPWPELWRFRSLQSSPPPTTVIFRQHPQITTFHLFCKCLWSRVIWFSLHCPSVDGSWWGLREPSLLFSWEPVPKQHLAMLRSQTHTHVHTHTHTHTYTHTQSVIQTATHMLNILYLTSSVYASRCRISSNHLSICSHSIKSHCSLLSAV